MAEDEETAEKIRKKYEKHLKKELKVQAELRKREERKARVQQRKEALSKRWQEYEEKHPTRASILKAVKEAPGEVKLGILEPLRYRKRMARRKERVIKEPAREVRPAVIPCPYCGARINSSIITCPYCSGNVLEEELRSVVFTSKQEKELIDRASKLAQKRVKDFFKELREQAQG